MATGQERRDNFDLLRLLAALEVLTQHCVFLLGLPHANPIGDFIFRLFTGFPGLQVFFVISGYLITMSLQRNSDLKNYARNRFLRIFPGFWTCFGVTLVLLTAFGALSAPGATVRGILIWSAAQMTVLQAYNPAFLRTFGCGVANGSMWTISVELQFYVLLPLIMLVLGRSRAPQRNVLLLLLLLASGALGYHVQGLDVAAQAHRNHVIQLADRRVQIKMLEVTLLPHLYMFVAGALLFLNQKLFVERFVKGRCLAWTLGYVVVSQACDYITPVGAPPPFVLYILRDVTLACWAVSFAQSHWRWGTRLLHGNDLSYGVYLYHMLVVNALIALGLHGRWILLPVVIGVTVSLALLSWRFVERPALSLKRSPARAPALPSSVAAGR